MNQGRVIDHQVLKYRFKSYPGMSGGVDTTYLEEGEEEFFEYLIKVEMSKGWTPQGNYYQSNHQFKQTMVKYEGFVTSNHPQKPVVTNKYKFSGRVLFWIVICVLILFLLPRFLYSIT